MTDTSPIATLPPELLERILQDLPMKDLLLAQRVSVAFKAVIDGSHTLQQDLFFVPRQADFAWAFRKPTLNHHVLQKVPHGDQKTDEDAEVLPSAIANPLIFGDGSRSKGLMHAALYREEKLYFDLMWRVWPLRPEASCRRMLICNSGPIRSFVHAWHCLGLPYQKGTARFERDVVFGDILDKIEDMETKYQGTLDTERYIFKTRGILHPYGSEAEASIIEHDYGQRFTPDHRLWS